MGLGILRALGGLSRGLGRTTGATTRMAGSASRVLPKSTRTAAQAAVPKATRLPKSTRTTAQRTGTPTPTPTPTPAAKPSGAARLAGGALSLLGNPYVVGASIVGPAALSIPDFKRSMKRNILDAGPVDGSEFAPNVLQQFITGMDADAYKDTYQQEKLDALMATGIADEPMSYGLRAPTKGESRARYLGAIAKDLRAAKLKEQITNEEGAAQRAFMSPGERYARDQQNLQLSRDYGLQRRQLEASIAQAEGQLAQSQLALSMAQTQQQNDYNMQMYREQLRADEMKQRRTESLIKGLASLGAGLAL